MASCARVYKIVGRKYDTGVLVDENLSLDDFEYEFEKTVKPQVVLEDNVSLYMLNKSEAIYVDCGNTDVFTSSSYPFTYEAQYQCARRLIILPIEKFHEVAEDIALPNIPMIHVFHHGRCGSTLLSKVFMAIPETVVVNDTKAFLAISRMSSNGECSEAELKKLVKSSFLNFTKHADIRRSKLFFVKQSSACTFIADLIMDVFPDMVNVFLYRDPNTFIESRLKIMAMNNIEDLHHLCVGYGKHKILTNMPSITEDEMNLLSVHSRIAVKWISVVAIFKELIRKGYKIHSLKFEDFTTHPKEYLLRIFLSSNISIPVQVDSINIDKVLAKDSQEGCVLSTRGIPEEEVKNFITPLNNNVTVKELNNLCEKFSIPRFRCGIRLPKPI